MPNPLGLAPIWREIHRHRLWKWETKRFYARLGEFRLTVSVRSDDIVVKVHHTSNKVDPQYHEIVQKGTGGIKPDDALIRRARLRCVAAALRLQRGTLS